METEQLIGVYHTGFIVCLILTILFVALSVLLFFKLRIRDVFNFMTGRAEKMTIRRMEEENAKTGKLRQEYLNPATSSDLYTTPSGNIPPVVYTPPGGDDGSAITERPHLQSGVPDDGSAKTERTHPDKNSPGGMQTAPQTLVSDGSEATTLLDAGGEATTILDQGGEATTLLNQGEGSEETTLLNQKPAAARYGQEGAPGETVLLTPQMEKEMADARAEEEKKKFPGKFVITKEQIWIHTEELI